MKYNNEVSFINDKVMHVVTAKEGVGVSRVAQVVNRIREIHTKIQNDKATTADHLELQILGDMYFEMRKLKVA